MIPQMGVIQDVKFRKGDNGRHRYWVSVRVPYGAISAVFCPEDVQKFIDAGHEVSDWQNIPRRVKTSVTASFTHDGYGWHLFEVFMAEPYAAPEREGDSCESDTCYERDAWARNQQHEAQLKAYVCTETDALQEVVSDLSFEDHEYDPRNNESMDSLWLDWERNYGR